MNKCVVVPPSVATVGPVGAHHALSRIMLILDVFGGMVGVLVGVADVVGIDVVRSSGNGSGD